MRRKEVLSISLERVCLPFCFYSHLTDTPTVDGEDYFIVVGIQSSTEVESSSQQRESMDTNN